MRSICVGVVGMLLSVAAGESYGAVIGRMTPPDPVTEARVHGLAAVQQDPWLGYLARSRSLMAADKAALATERAGKPAPQAPASAHPGTGMPLNKNSAWYGTPEARHVADNIVSFQTPAGGWSKNADRSGPLRERGQGYVAGTDAWHYVGTIDNDATVTEMRFLARAQAQAPGAAGQAYRDAFLKGLRYLLDAQYPNGGFPQVYPLEGGYQDAVTFNDDAIFNVVQILTAVAGRQGDYAFVPLDAAVAAREATAKTVGLILATQLHAGGVPTGWCQQYDALTLAPVGARNFEPIALASGESANVLIFLMGLPDPSPQVVEAVHAGAAWLERAEVRNVEWTAKSPGTGRMLVPRPGGGPLWSRYYDMESMKPIFGDRDRTIHDDVNELSLERRNGYSWYGAGPGRALRLYRSWSRMYPRAAA